MKISSVLWDLCSGDLDLVARDMVGCAIFGHA